MDSMPKMMDVMLKLMDVMLKMMDVMLKMMDSMLKMMDFMLKMIWTLCGFRCRYQRTKSRMVRDLRISVEIADTQHGFPLQKVEVWWIYDRFMIMMMDLWLLLWIYDGFMIMIMDLW